MKRMTLRLLACAGIAAFGTAALSTDAFAQVSATVPITVSQSATITVANDTDIAYGTWMLVHDGSNDITLDMATDGTVTPTAGGDSQAVEVAAGTVGAITVTAPAAGDLTICSDAPSAMSDAANYAFTLPVYQYAGGAADQALPLCSGSPDTVSATGAADTVSLGGLMTVSGTPADGAASGTIDIDIDFP
ncbi:MAG: hypothetical protein ACLFU1_00005 [Alphaproteobacteria bacterium]